MCGLFLFGQHMQRAIVYAGSIPLETDILKTNQYAMVGLAKLSAAMFGASGVVVNGLACTPTGPAGLTVNVAPGEMYSLQNLEATAYSSLPADTAHQILKQGVSLDTVNLSCPAPATVGQSINYLVQAAFQEADQNLVALPYYNASNPTQAWSGPGNTGTAQATIRSGNIVLSAKAGTAATTGSQTTPAADSGFTGLWVVTVANGQTQITAANIAQATNAPILPSDLLHSIQASSLIVGTDSGAANACVVNYSYPVTALTDGMVLWFKAKAANTGATTLNVNGLGAQPVVGANHSALQGGEIVANGKAQVVWNATITSWVLVECTGGALQVAPATASQHAAQLQQVGHGQCRLSVSSTTTLLLKPYNGNNVIVNGVPLQLPSAGVSIANTGLAASTVYYAYLAGNTASPSLVLSTTTHVTGSNGVEVMSGDATKTLVGMIATNSSSQFSDINSFRGCLNWFNRRSLPLLGTSATFSTASTSAVTIGNPVTTLSWSDSGGMVTMPNNAYSNVAAGTVQTAISLDGTVTSSQSIVTSGAIAQIYNGTPVLCLGLSEGSHLLVPVANAGASSGTITCTNALFGFIFG